MAIVHLNISPEQEAALTARAQRRGLSVEEHIVQLLREDLAEMDRVLGPLGPQNTQDKEQP